MPGVTVLSRARPDYEPPGIHAGDFLVAPSFEAGVGYDSNVLGGPGSPGSWTLGTHPLLRVTSDWSRDAVAGVLGLDDTRYLDAPRQSRTDATMVLGGTKLIGRDQLTVAVAYLDLHEDRSALDALPSDTPVGLTLTDARVGYTLALDRLSLTPNLEVSGYRYDNTTIMGVPASQAYRNRDVLAGGLTARYELMARQRRCCSLSAAPERITSCSRRASRRAIPPGRWCWSAWPTTATRSGATACCSAGRSGTSPPAPIARMTRRWPRRRRSGARAA